MNTDPVIRAVLATVPYDGEDRARLCRIFAPAPVTFVAANKPAELRHGLQTADVAVLAGSFDRGFLEAPKLRWIHCDHAGLERCASPEVLASDLRVTGSAGRSAPALAEHALFFMLSLCYDSVGLLEAQRRKRWGTQGMRELRGLYGRTLGIVGMGHTGKALATRAKALGMKVHGFRRRSSACPPGVDRLYSMDAGDAIDDLLPELDYLVLAASLNDGSRGMIGERQLGLLKPSARLVNIARGALVDESALVQALASGKLAGAGLDVFEHEPLPPGSPLWRTPRTLITPHCTPQVPDRTGRSLDILEENVRRWRAGEPLLNELKAEDVYSGPADQESMLARPPVAGARVDHRRAENLSRVLGTLATGLDSVRRPRRSERPTVSDVSSRRVAAGIELEVYWLATPTGAGPSASVYARGDEILRFDCFGPDGHLHLNMKQAALVQSGAARIYFSEPDAPGQIREASFWFRRNLAYALATNLSSRVRGLRPPEGEVSKAAAFMEEAMATLEARRGEMPA